MGRPPRIVLVGVVPFVLLVGVLILVAVRGGQDDGRLPAADVEPEDADVVVIGDSVTDQSSEQIVAAMAGRQVSVVGLPGYRTDHLLGIIEDALGGDARPGVAVVMAGYNDLWQRTERDAPIDEAMDLLAGVDCGVWVLVPTEGPWDRDRAEAFDRRVRQAAEEAGVAVATGWRDAVDDGAGPDPDPELVAADGVHPAEAGRRRVAAVVAAAVDRVCG